MNTNPPTGKRVVLVRLKGREVFTIHAEITDWRLHHATGQVGAIQLTGYREEDGRRLRNRWYSVGPDALDGSLVSHQTVCFADCGHPLAADCGGCDASEATPQLRWEADVRAELTRLGFDPAEVEARAEGFGQDFADWHADPAGYAHVVASDANGPCPCGCCGPDDDCRCDDECCDCNLA